LGRLHPAEVRDALERYPRAFLAAFTLLYLPYTSLLASAKLLWNDEITTLYLSRLPFWSGQWRALMTGVDSHPPLHYALTSLALLVPGPVEWTARLPSIAGYWLMAVCIFYILLPRVGALYAAAGAGLALTCGTYAYAFEARPYALLCGFTALAFLCWQRAASSTGSRAGWLAGLAIALGLAGVTHYFSALIWAALGLGELARISRQRRVDWPVWGALAAGLLPATGCLPLAVALKRAVGTNFWAQATLGSAMDAYRSMLSLAFAPILGGLLLWALLRAVTIEASPRQSAQAAGAIRLHEAVAAAALAALPWFGLVLGRFTGGFAERYVYHATPGVILVAAALAGLGSRRSALLGISLVAALFGWYCLKLPGAYGVLQAESGAPLWGAPHPYESREWVAQARRSDLPIAATNSVFFSKLQHYAPAGLSERIHYLADPESGLRYDGQTTGDAVMRLNREVFGMRVADYAVFTAAHRRFLVCAHLSQPTWLLTRLAEDGATLVLRSREGPEVLFEASLPRTGDSSASLHGDRAPL
jgi:4-amino-4-deoxy-L-arabinose transferase-like glycosyltransferase